MGGMWFPKCRARHWPAFRAIKSAPHTRIASLLIAACLASTYSLTAIAESVDYVHDASGRLVGVTDEDGAAKYVYDDNGNIMRIERLAVDELAVLSFSPPEGHVGQSIELYANGLTSAQAPIQVLFAGTPATIESVTANTLTVTVPSGATSGLIELRDASGASAVSNEPFLVVPDPATLVPTITGLSSLTGVPGEQIVISGQNFPATVSEIQIRLADSLVQVVDVSATSATVKLPNTVISGQFKATTQYGTALSASSFTVLPPVSGLSASGNEIIPLALGETRTLSLVSGGDSYVFSVDVEDASGITVDAFEIDAGLSARFRLFSPALNQLQSRTMNSPDELMNWERLYGDRNKPYFLVVEPPNSGAGSLSLVVHDASELTGLIGPDNSPITLTKVAPRQFANLYHEGNEGERVSLLIPNSPMSLTLSISDANGNVLGFDSNFDVGDDLFVDPVVLPYEGLYRVFVGQRTGLVTLATPRDTGTYSVSMYRVPSDDQGQIQFGDPPRSLSVTVPGQNAELQFNATAGQKALVLGSNASIYRARALVRDSNGSTLGSESLFIHSLSSQDTAGVLEPVQLPQTGTYSLVIDPETSSTGDITVELIDVSDFVANIAPDGIPVQVDLPQPYQQGLLSFSANSGDRVSLYVPGGPGDIRARIRDPDGKSLDSDIEGSYTFIDTLELTDSGTHKIQIEKLTEEVASTHSVHLYSVPETQTTYISIGQLQTVTATVPGENALLTFDGTAGQRVNIRGYNADVHLAEVVLRSPSGSLVKKRTSFGAISIAKNSLGSVTLPSTGLYSVLYNPIDHRTGSIDLRVELQ